MSKISRRTVLAGGLAGATLATTAQRAVGQGAIAPFAHGVASGDPGPDRVLIWTRAHLGDGGPVDGEWQVASDPSFDRIVQRGAFRATKSSDHTVKVDVSGLIPGTAYWYRFIAGGDVSSTGRTQTLPNGTLDRLEIVLACCAMYTQGEFHAYQAIAERPVLDLVLFIGDYIYEYGTGGIRITPDIRPAEPAGDTVTLDDYRARYAQWRRDPALQAAHARAAWICMWDDHEIANDDWMGGAQHHDPITQGPWDARKAAAVRAYLEWMPIRNPSPEDPFAINRSFRFGDLATLVLPETRLEARDRQLTLGRDLAGRTAADIAVFRQKLADPSRRMIGPTQIEWLDRTVAENDSAGRPWILFGSPTIMASYVYPDLKPMLPPQARAKIDARWPGFSTVFDQSGLGLPLFNLDSWDGYPAERERVFDLFERSSANIVVLSGDSHMAWANNLHHNGRQLAVEVSASTLTGPSMGHLLQLDDAPLGDVFVRDNPDIAWCDHLAVGIVTISVKRDAVEARFLSVATPRSASSLVTPSKAVRTTWAKHQVDGWDML